MSNTMQYCTRCLTPSTRPRVVFNEESVCNACQWAEKKKLIDWPQKWNELEKLCDGFRRKDDFDVIIPCSGGKDGSYVAWKMKHDLGMHPLCVTVSPPLQTEIGRCNLDNFRNSGFDLIEIRPNLEIYRLLCKRMFVEQARSKFPFVIAISTVVAHVALKLAMFALSVEFLKVSVFSIGYQYSKILLKVIHINCSKDLIIFFHT